MTSTNILMPPQVLAAMERAGFPPEIAVTLTAIAMRESGGPEAEKYGCHADAFNGNAATGDRSYGLAQINLRDEGIRKVVYEQILQIPYGPTPDLDAEKRLFDPDLNAKTAHLLWGGSNHNLDILWSILNNPKNRAAYEAHLPAAQMAVLGLTPPAPIVT